MPVGSYNRFPEIAAVASLVRNDKFGDAVLILSLRGGPTGRRGNLLAARCRNTPNGSNDRFPEIAAVASLLRNDKFGDAVLILSLRGGPTGRRGNLIAAAILLALSTGLLALPFVFVGETIGLPLQGAAFLIGTSPRLPQSLRSFAMTDLAVQFFCCRCEEAQRADVAISWQYVPAKCPLVPITYAAN